MMKIIVASILLSLGVYSTSDAMTVQLYLTDQNGKKISVGQVDMEDTIYGLLVTPHLHDLSPGIHGFHIHEFPFCGDKGMAAGGHLDPQHTNQHRGPYSGSGHLGDLPVLIVDKNGRASLPVLAPRLKIASVENHALMVHSGGDNYSDTPEKLGGGDGRMACGVIGYEH